MIYCHTRIQLGNFNSAWNLSILQIGPNSGIIFDLINTHQPLGQKTYLKESKIFGMLSSLLKKVWNVSGWCQEGILKVSEVVWKGSWKCMEGEKSFLKESNILGMSSRLLYSFWSVWVFTKIKMKTYTWNSSVALLSPNCLFIYFSTFLPSRDQSIVHRILEHLHFAFCWLPLFSIFMLILSLFLILIFSVLFSKRKPVWIKLLPQYYRISAHFIV